MDTRDTFLATGDDRLLPIVDAHHHFFDLERNPHPWLQQRPLIPFRYGDYSAICRSYPPADYRAAWGGHNVVASVLMEGEWDPRDPLSEARWASEVAHEHGLPNAIVGQVWLDRDDLPEVLAGLAAFPLVRSVRHKPRVTTRAEHDAHFAPPGSMRCPRWRAGYAQLARYGLQFELQAPWWHFGEARELARDFPATMIIVNHAGLPADRSAEGLAAWRRALALLADEPNVRLKISGIGVPGQPWTAALQAPVIDGAIDTFGVARCAFASNHPVDGLCASFQTIYQVFKEVTRRRSPQDRLQLFHDNARAWYGLSGDH
ncbi:MAG TPA: amidohydrolase family protein [Burkholderiaceae bacterium]|nr:amidohydrolase family protein [Burkholderiaceae bacterium]